MTKSELAYLVQTRFESLKQKLDKNEQDVKVLDEKAKLNQQPSIMI
jgi:hypothetical protein